MQNNFSDMCWHEHQAILGLITEKKSMKQEEIADVINKVWGYIE